MDGIVPLVACVQYYIVCCLSFVSIGLVFVMCDGLSLSIIGVTILKYALATTIVYQASSLTSHCEGEETILASAADEEVGSHTL